MPLSGSYSGSNDYSVPRTIRFGLPEEDSPGKNVLSAEFSRAKLDSNGKS